MEPRKKLRMVGVASDGKAHRPRTKVLTRSRVVFSVEVLSSQWSNPRQESLGLNAPCLISTLWSGLLNLVRKLLMQLLITIL